MELQDFHECYDSLAESLYFNDFNDSRQDLYDLSYSHMECYDFRDFHDSLMEF